MLRRAAYSTALPLSRWHHSKLEEAMNKSTTQISPLLTRAALLAALVTALGAAPFAAQAADYSNRVSECHNCGTVISTRTYQKPAASGNGVGIVGGAVIGGLLGNQVGGGAGRKVATVAGAVGGGYAGNEIEKRARSTTVTEVRVRMSDGSERTFTEAGANRRHSGAHVKVVKGALVAQR
jgi:outer membrane lipoprotein SlyB